MKKHRHESTKNYIKSVATDYTDIHRNVIANPSLVILNGVKNLSFRTGSVKQSHIGIATPASAGAGLLSLLAMTAMLSSVKFRYLYYELPSVGIATQYYTLTLVAICVISLSN